MPKLVCHRMTRREELAERRHRFVEAARDRVLPAWERLAIALHLRKPPRPTLRARLPHRH